MNSEVVPSAQVTLAGRIISFVGDPGEHYSQSLTSFHAAAPRLEDYVRRHLRRNATCIDIGSNIGLTAILLALYCPEGRVYCFEASPKNARNLRRNLTLNGIENCVVVDTAVGERCGEVWFRETAFCAGSHVALPSTGTAQDAALIRVPMVSIDTFMEQQGLPAAPVDFIKIDVEGFEPAILAGAARTIERRRCPIFMEFNSWCLLLLQNFNPLAFATAVFDNFEVSRIESDGSLTSDAYGTAGEFLYTNFFRNGCVDDLLLRLKSGKEMPSLAEMTKWGEDLSNLHELRRLRDELQAIRAAA